MRSFFFPSEEIKVQKRKSGFKKAKKKAEAMLCSYYSATSITCLPL
jgi:hypothetical protein